MNTFYDNAKYITKAFPLIKYYVENINIALSPDGLSVQYIGRGPGVVVNAACLSHQSSSPLLWYLGSKQTNMFLPLPIGQDLVLSRTFYRRPWYYEGPP